MAGPLQQLLANLDWTTQQREDFDEAFQHSKSEVNIVVTGVTGSGKSTIINALCGAVPKESRSTEVAADGAATETELPAKEGSTLHCETDKVTSYVAQSTSCTEDGVCGPGRKLIVRVWDSPGLEDGTNKGRVYVNELKATCGDNIDMLLYCIDVSKAKSIVDEMVRGLRVVTDILGSDVWRHSMIVLTFANILEENIQEEVSVEPESGQDVRHIFITRINHWQQKVRLALVEAGVPQEIAKSVPIEPAGIYTEPHLPDRIHWLGYLWLLFITYARDEAKLAILINNQHRIRNAEYLTPVTLEEPVIIIDKDHFAAIKIGTTISVGVASAVGAFAGGVTGSVVAGSLTAGLGTGVGLAAGAAVGAVIGPLLSLAVRKVLQKRRKN